LVQWIYWYLVIAYVYIQEAIIFLSSKSLQYLIYEWKWEMCFSRGLVQFFVINAHFPTYHCSCGNESLFLFWITIISPFLGTTLKWLTQPLFNIGYIIPASSSFVTSFLTTSFIVGLRRLWGIVIDLYSSSSKSCAYNKMG